MTATTIRPRPGWIPPDELDVLEATDELLALREARQRAEQAFEQARARVGELLDERERLQARVLDGTATARNRERLAELTIRIAQTPGEAAAAAADFATATIRWAYYVEDEAIEVERAAQRDQERIFRALPREEHRRTAKLGATPAYRQALEDAEPHRQRQLAADRLKRHARSRIYQLLRVSLRRRTELNEARRRFVERARAEAAAEVTAG